ncbi:ABC-F family ATP-binding cassette domain-containing protein [Lactobacillus delbrueckii]|uniref:ABC transporter, ATP-binding protein n=1 Tax=Lactobacillus delbrueckii subsp. bulgaricus (strain ATCC 11842 / DSM 20081 / BCRC 10696 / JCM 1002 / NBRC 13953 / NCIMB 11778 / NCTC 12712 / WDCM 00102 / Lb 14) TaxID=390333 RepID=Q1G934_LACDA|nr:ABC-F family ATP-binding cassette domain-containing protein [Lactobacillus delbrueckii]ALT47955.1 ABC transporter [Lactobacillus delbrueckii subsp. bulgaricus]APV47735.1 ABC transporter [Lactobacillus delbrueckii subsp. bulgaricus]AYC67077.1 ABC transporter ATP-binding protein [Lactobacillus delbrueckii subsp. bulgaricus]KIY25204.1 ABC transporter [Lactobacillus delbrueckii subsp. bulgaricus]MBT9023479.1 ABC transporter [Lactobacillus delbrueckii subsp. bulgaricus]
MIIAQGHNLEQRFGAAPIFSKVNFSIENNARIGLVGPNGAGKTTLLKIMTGRQEASQGEFTVNKGIELGYIAQEHDFDEEKSIWEEMLTVFQPLIDQGQQLEKLQYAIADHPEDEDLLRRLDQAQYNFEQAGGYTYQAEIKSMLNGFNFPEATWNKQIASLSGGEKTRLSFVKLLLKKPPLLLLDEPTNYLDLDTLDWLEAFLKNYPGAILTVSHDQYFLDHLATQIFELQHGELTVFKGNYSQYLAQRELRDQQQEAAYEKQQEEIKREEEFIQKNIVRASTTKQAQSRRKALEKMELVDPPKHKSKVRIKFDSARPSGKEVLILKDLAVGYPDKTMLKDISFQINKGDRVAIIGQNGIGKSTLLKTVMKQLPVKSGAIKYGASLDIGYYDQELQGIDYSKTVIDTIWDRHKDMNEKDIRSILASFLFTAKDIDKKVSQLSGGQRARLTLTVLSMEHNNFLLMDEPTNHLDLDAKEVLEKALADYDGTLLFVSHDRYFINELANKIVVAKDGQAKIYEGNYTYYLNEKAKEEAAAQETAAQEAPVVKAVSESKFSYQEQKKRDSEKRKLERQVAQAEKDLEELEAKEQEIQEAMADPAIAADFSKLGPLQEDLTAVQEKISQVSQAWEDASLALEEF